MKITKLDDYQSWMISEGDTHVLVDPWLTERLMWPPLGGFLFERGRKEPPLTPSALPRPRGIFLSAMFESRVSPATLRSFDRETPVHAPRAAASRLRGLGFTNVRTHTGGSTFDVGPLRMTTITPGFPYAGSSLGYLVESRVSETRVYLEAHATNEGGLTAIPAGLDALICPCESVFSGLVQLSMDPERTARTIARLRPKRFLPTGIEPSRNGGLLGRHGVRTSGTVADLERILVARRLETQLIAPRTGESISLV